MRDPLVSQGSTRSGKARCQIFNVLDGGIDRARPQNIEQEGQHIETPQHARLILVAPRQGVSRRRLRTKAVCRLYIQSCKTTFSRELCTLRASLS
jgi:hypothetical protein